MPLGDWIPGVVLISFSILKFYGLRYGIEGGRGKSFGQRLCGTCPTWKSRGLKLGVPFFFLVAGLACFVWGAHPYVRNRWLLRLPAVAFRGVLLGVLSAIGIAVFIRGLLARTKIR